MNITSSIRCLSCINVSFEKDRNVPPMATESGITLNAPPPWNFATVTTYKHTVNVKWTVGILMKLKQIIYL